MHTTKKNIININIPYWLNKKIQLKLIKTKRGKDADISLYIYWLHKLPDLPRFKGTWFGSKRNIFNLWKNY